MHAFSTCWNSGRQTRGRALVEEILELGFQTIELSHGLRVPLLQEIEKEVQKGRVTVCGVHNFCPMPVEVLSDAPDCYEYSSHRPAERRRALKLTLQSLETAARLQASYVVLHLGRVAMRSSTRALIEMAREGKIFSREYTRLKLQAVRDREKLSRFYLDRVRESLRPILEKAAELGISVGLENRSRYEDIPSERELPGLLEEFPGAGYWHDFGHAQTKVNLGFFDHTQWLASVRHRLLGCHLHDTAWPDRDHLAPFHGGIEWEKLVPILPENCLLVWEMNPRRTASEIQNARTLWRGRFGS